jgi:hypothetical protein
MKHLHKKASEIQVMHYTTSRAALSICLRRSEALAALLGNRTAPMLLGKMLPTKEEPGKTVDVFPGNIRLLLLPAPFSYYAVLLRASLVALHGL